MDRGGSCSAPMETGDRPDLSLLKPLWSLYTSMLEKEGGEIYIPVAQEGTKLVIIAHCSDISSISIVRIFFFTLE